MLLSRTSFVSLAAIIASLTLVPMASGEIIYKATGVDYVKRFQPSSGACYYVCPTFVTSGTQADGTPTTTYDSSNNPNGQDDGTLTTCTYSNPTASDGFPVYNTQCIYGSVSGDFVVQTGDTTGICASKAEFNNQACTAVGKKRTLSRVERRVKDRQFNPKKVRDVK